ncbi:MAG: cell division protein FtsZ [Verrucomicrobia bacterium]|nr:MAG: cell division protein FtsZ [Verrucomicrobiota bacterium]
MTNQDKIVSSMDSRELRLKVFGVGGAGCNAVEHFAHSEFAGVEFAAVNTDVQALLDLSVGCVVPLGATLTRGLGAGGDPEVGRAAAEEDAEKLCQLCAGAEVVVIVTGLGGGTGTGASPVLARAAKEAGALVVAIATLPFECEGARRRSQAQAGLEELKETADAVLCLPNQRVIKLIDENTSLIETFKITNDLLAQGLRGIWRLLARAGIINVDFADLCAVVRGQHAESSFACAEAQGEHRAREVVEMLLASPWLEGGAVLNEAESVLVSIVAGSDLTMAEVNRVMSQINHACEYAHIIMGAAVEAALGDRLSVTVIASRRPQPETEAADAVAAAAVLREGNGVTSKRTASETVEASAFDVQFIEKNPPTRPPSRFVPPPPELGPDKKQQLLAQQKRKPYRKPGSKMRQGTLPLEIVSKGRFEKSEPTIYHGEDLDVPTYIRRGVPLN